MKNSSQAGISTLTALIATSLLASLGGGIAVIQHQPQIADTIKNVLGISKVSAAGQDHREGSSETPTPTVESSGSDTVTSATTLDTGSVTLPSGGDATTGPVTTPDMTAVGIDPGAAMTPVSSAVLPLPVVTQPAGSTGAHFSISGVAGDDVEDDDDIKSSTRVSGGVQTQPAVRSTHENRDD